MKKSHGPTVSVQDLVDLAQELEAWDQATANRENRSVRLSEHKQYVARKALRDALEFSVVRPLWLSLQTRLARAELAMRDKKGRARVDAFAREMGVVQSGGRRSADLNREGAELVVWKYIELITLEGPVLYVDPKMLWASGREEQRHSNQGAQAMDVEFLPIEHLRPIVMGPVQPVEAVTVIADWFAWRFSGNPQAVREFLERERKRLKRERSQLEGSRKAADRTRLEAMPRCDFRIPGRTTVVRGRR